MNNFTSPGGETLTDRIDVECEGENFNIFEFRTVIISHLENDKEYLTQARYELVHNKHTVNRLKENPEKFIDPLTKKIYTVLP